MRSIAAILLFLTFHALGESLPSKMQKLPFDEKALKKDLEIIFTAANLNPAQFQLTFKKDQSNKVRFNCQKDEFHFIVSSTEEEMTSTLYKAMREIGFLFPHPRKQISPSLMNIKKKCNIEWNWRPALTFRGFHLHTLHPNEWVEGFLSGNKEIAESYIRWLARNQQNIFDLSLLNLPLSTLKGFLEGPFLLAKRLQIHTGVSLGIALNQQNSYKLLNFFETLTENKSKRKMKKELEKLLESLPLSYLVLEAGTSEFTPTNFKRSIDWLNLAGEVTAQKNIALFTKVHVSSNQKSERWGNFNFLPQHCESSVGILPHTVMFYGLLDEKAPMYGNKNFHAIRDFMLKEMPRRPTWYYPETSYWVAMDVDVPLYLTDYFTTRAEDTKYLFENGVEGQLNFTSGHVLGYWSFDWNLALMTDLDYSFDPQIGLKLLNEDIPTWTEIIDYQKKWYKEKGLIALLSSANLQDEISKTHRIHDRFTMRDLNKNEKQLEKEIILLKESLLAFPRFDKIKNEELRNLIQINYLRHQHATYIREALLLPTRKEEFLNQAKLIRLEAIGMIQKLQNLSTNYPELKLFKRWNNPTAYQFGYAYPAATLYFWEREENQIRENSYFPFKNNIYDIFDIIF